VPRFLVDTDTLSQPAKKVPNAGVMEQLAEHRDEIATAIFVYHDLYFIATSAKERATREAFSRFLRSEYFARIEVLPYDRSEAEEHARLRAGREKTAPWTDAQIAAVAATGRLTLVTHNRRHFDGYPDLKVVDWFS
jgi:tRNA(fMet)-specific endonuclease VapC